MLARPRHLLESFWLVSELSVCKDRECLAFLPESSLDRSLCDIPPPPPPLLPPPSLRLIVYLQVTLGIDRLGMSTTSSLIPTAFSH